MWYRSRSMCCRRARRAGSGSRVRLTRMATTSAYRPRSTTIPIVLRLHGPTSQRVLASRVRFTRRAATSAYRPRNTTIPIVLRLHGPTSQRVLIFSDKCNAGELHLKPANQEGVYYLCVKAVVLTKSRLQGANPRRSGATARICNAADGALWAQFGLAQG